MSSICLTLLCILSNVPSSADGNSDDAYIREFQVPVPASGPLGIDVMNDGTVWFTLEGANAIASFSPDTGEFTFIEVPWAPDQPVQQFGMEGILVDDEAREIWFTHGSTNRIGRFYVDSGIFEAFEIPTPQAKPLALLRDSNGSVWFTELLGDKIGAITTEGRILEYELPRKQSGPAGLYLDGGGNIWFTEAFSGRIGVLNRSAITITEYAPPPGMALSSPVGILVDENGLVWIAEHGGNGIARFNPRDGSWKKFSTSQAPPEIFPVSIPNDLEMDGQGQLWVTEHAGNKIAKFDRTTHVLTEYTIPTFRAITLWLAIGPDGRIWFAEAEGNKIGVLDSSIQVPFSISTAQQSLSVAAGSGASLTVTVARGGTYQGRISLSAFALPSTITHTFQPPDIASGAGSTSTATFHIPEDLQEGEYPMSISAGDGKVTRTITINMTVRPGEQVNLTLLIPLSVIIAASAILAVVLMRTKRKAR